MPDSVLSYKVEPWRCGHERGLRLRLLKNYFEVERGGIFTPNGGGEMSMQFAEEKAHEVGQIWVEDNSPKSEIPF